MYHLDSVHDRPATRTQNTPVRTKPDCRACVESQPTTSTQNTPVRTKPDCRACVNERSGQSMDDDDDDDDEEEEEAVPALGGTIVKCTVSSTRPTQSFSPGCFLAMLGLMF